MVDDFQVRVEAVSNIREPVSSSRSSPNVGKRSRSLLGIETILDLILFNGSDSSRSRRCFGLERAGSVVFEVGGVHDFFVGRLVDDM